MAKATISEHEALEQALKDKNPQLQDYLATTGVIGDETFKDPEVRKTQQKKRKHLYHNTQVLMENYQTMLWVIENFPAAVAEELSEPMAETDRLLERIDLEFAMENHRLENRIRTIAKSRCLIDRVNVALTMLRSKPGDGEDMYQVIYQTYIKPEFTDIWDLFAKLALSRRRYYHLRGNAFGLMSLALWSGPSAEITRWLEIVEMLEEMKMR